jgi:hypothetical protein
MRKWLVGLLAAGLCAASAWATTDVLTAADLAATSTTYTEFSNVTKDSGAVYAGKSSKSSAGAIQLRTTGNDCGIVTTESGGTATKVTLAWNDATDDAREVSVYGNSEAYTAASDLYSADAQGTLLGSLKKGDGATELEIEGEYAYIGLRSKSGALYLDSVEIEWAGGTPPVFSVKLDPAEDFEVFQGKSASITATVKGAQGDVTYSWSVNGTPIDLAGNVYTVDSADLGEYEVSVEVADGVADPLSASVKYTVVEAPVVTGDVLTRETTGVSGTSYKDWTATGDSGAEYAGNSAGGNDSIQMRTTNPSGIVITKSSGKDVASVTVEWNDATAAEKRSLEIYGSTEAYAGPAALYEASTKGELLGTIARDGATLEIPEGYPYVGILAKGGAVYLTSVAFEFAGEAGLSVTLDKANGFTVDLGSPDSITATAKNGAEPYTYAWTSDTPDLNGTGETLAIPATLAEGDYTVQVEVTDAESNKANKQIYFSVVAPAQKYAVNVAIGILNGGVTADKEEAEEGELVTLTASPAAGYKLGTFLVDDAAIDGSTFNMPAKDVLVSATFVEKPVVAGFTKIMSLDELTEGEYVITGAKAAGEEYAMMASVYDGKTAYLERRETAVELEEDVVTDAEDSIIWTLAQGENGWTIYNEAVGYAGYVASGNSSGAEAEPSAKSSWTIAESENEGLFLLTNVGDTGRYLLYNASNPRFACYTNLNSGKHLAFYKGASGPAVPSVSLSASATEVEVGEPVTITATAKNFSAEPKWSWTGNGTADGAVFTLDTSVADTYEVTATATAGEETASKSVTITVKAPAVKYAVNVALSIQNGTVTTDVSSAAEGDPVTVTATPADGYRLVAIIVNNGDVAVSGNTFVMPAQEVLVTATFEEFEVPPYYFQFETGANIAYAATEAEIDNTGSTKDEVPTVGFSVQRATRGKDAGDKVVGTYALRLAPIGETNAFAYNSKAFAEALTAISFQYGIYGTSDKCDSFTVSTSEDGETWTVLADLSESAATELKTFESSELPANTYFIRFDSTSTVKGNTRRMCIDEIQLFTGAPKPSISYTGDTTVKIPGSFSLQFSVKNYEGTVAWAVTSREGGTISEAGLYTWTPTEATDGITISVSATGEGLDLSKSVTLVVEPKDEPGPGEPTLTCEEGTTINATVDKELVLHFTLANAEFFTGDGAESLIGNTSSLGEVSDITATSFVWTYTPTETGTVTLDFYAMSEGYESVIIESYTVTLNVTEGGGGGDAVTVKSYVVNADGSVTVTLSDGSTTSAGLQYSTDLKNWSTTPVNVKTAASAFVRVGAPE